MLLLVGVVLSCRQLAGDGEDMAAVGDVDDHVTGGRGVAGSSDVADRRSQVAVEPVRATTCDAQVARPGPRSATDGDGDTWGAVARREAGKQGKGR